MARRRIRGMARVASLLGGCGLLFACAESEKLSDGFDAEAGVGTGGVGASDSGLGGSSDAPVGGSGGFSFGGAGAAAGAGGIGGGGGVSASGGSSASGGGGGSSASGGTSASGGSGGTSASGGGGGTGALDPNLSVPNPSGQPCTTPGYGTGCPSLQVCRISGPNQGTCESCTQCGNLGASCGSSAQCDILFQCYLGKCTNICPLGTSYCGPPQDCLNVGHATHGVCKP